MPKVFISEQDRQLERLKKALYGQMKIRSVTTSDLGELWGISQAGASYRIRTGTITAIDLWKANKILHFDSDDICRLIIGDDWRQKETAAAPHHRDPAASNRN